MATNYDKTSKRYLLSRIGFPFSVLDWLIVDKQKFGDVEQSTGSYLRLYQEIEDYLSNFTTIFTYNQFNAENKLIENY